MSNRFFTILVAFFLLLAFAVPAAALRKQAPQKEYRKTRRGSGALTVAMLEDCIRLDRKVDDASALLTDTDSNIKIIERQVVELKTYIDTEIEAIDNTNQTAVDLYNAKVDQHQGAVDSYNKLLQERKTLLDSYQTLRSRFNNECANQSQYDEDYAEAVKNVGYGITN